MVKADSANDRRSSDAGGRFDERTWPKPGARGITPNSPRQPMIGDQVTQLAVEMKEKGKVEEGERLRRWVGKAEPWSMRFVDAWGGPLGRDGTGAGLEPSQVQR